MSINFYPSGIEDITNNPRLRPSIDVSASVQGELQSLSAEFIAQRDAALANLASLRTPQGEATCSGSSTFIASCSHAAKSVLSDMFAVKSPAKGYER
jgi:hypothetical protein